MLMLYVARSPELTFKLGTINVAVIESHSIPTALHFYCGEFLTYVFDVWSVFGHGINCNFDSTLMCDEFEVVSVMNEVCARLLILFIIYAAWSIKSITLQVIRKCFRWSLHHDFIKCILNLKMFNPTNHHKIY